VSQYDDRVGQTRSLIQGAKDALSELSDDHRALNPVDLDRLSEAIDYAEQVLGRTKPTLIPDDAWNNLEAALQATQEEARNQTESFVTGRTRTLASSLVSSVSTFPPARGRIPEQQATAAIEKVREEADARIAGLKEQLTKLASEEMELSQAIDLRGTQLGESMAKRQAELEAAIKEVENQVAAERQRIESTTTEQAETFRAAQEEQANEAKAQIERYGELVDKAEAEFYERANATLEELHTMRDQSAELVGAIGVTGTAERYREEANNQRDRANNWRWLAIVGGLGAVGIAIFAAATASDPMANDTLVFIGKLAIGVALGGIAAYAAKQSGRHRDREEAARAMKLDLTAFNTFIEPLPGDKQDEERVALGRRIFGQHYITQELKGKEVGPGTLDQLVQLVGQRLQAMGLSDGGGQPPAST
jgi:hypothetical protein